MRVNRPGVLASPVVGVEPPVVGVEPKKWLPGRDSNPDRQIQNLLSYH